jgi:hypothetical protein
MKTKINRTKTTLYIDDHLMREIKSYLAQLYVSAGTEVTLTIFLNDALTQYLNSKKSDTLKNTY